MSEALIRSMLKMPSLPPAVRDKIVGRASGNPFFIEEVVQSLIDSDAVALRHGVFEVTEKIDTVLIPPTINDVVMARIDVLEEETRNLLKVASVIGRNFFYRILKEVARTVEDIDSKLSYLKEVQLIRERKRMGETEYLFKHALVQEAAYESILHQRRKEIHLRVAESIEKVFSQRLQEFYGMLAYHYSRGENVEKTEAYLIKAGEEALRSSASSEALNYYQEGLKLYLQKYGDAADPEKLATFEKNIALAFFNNGQYENALEYFDRVLEIWGARPPKNRLTTGLKVIYDLLNVIAHLYLPLRKAKKMPDQRDNEIFHLSYKRSMALVHSDPKRCFIEFLNTIKRLNRFDITRIENGLGFWMSASGLFAWSGISFKLSKKILQYNEDNIDKNNVKQVFYHDLFELLHNCFAGDWLHVKEYDEDLAAKNLRIGESWHVLNYLLFHSNIKIDQGNFEDAEAKIGKVSEIWEAYGNENAIATQHFLKLRLLAIKRKLYDAQLEADAGIAFHQSQTGRQQSILYYFGYKAIIQILQKDIREAKESLLRAKELLVKQGRVPPIYNSSYLVGEFLFDLYLLDQAVLSGEKSDTLMYRKKALRSGKQALKNSRKYAFNRTEALRLMGLYFWLIGSQKKAAKLWNISIGESERLGARVELARTYMEIGRRLTEKRSRLSELNGIQAEEYLDKARFMFEEMDLRWDLDELNRIPASR
jgi:tetratricopeptide (TPR) repeat protein